MKINFSLNRYVIFIALIDITFLKKNIYVEKFLFRDIYKRYFNLKFVRYERQSTCIICLSYNKFYKFQIIYLKLMILRYK